MRRRVYKGPRFRLLALLAIVAVAEVVPFYIWVAEDEVQVLLTREQWRDVAIVQKTLDSRH